MGSDPRIVLSTGTRPSVWLSLVWKRTHSLNRISAWLTGCVSVVAAVVVVGVDGPAVDSEVVGAGGPSGFGLSEESAIVIESGVKRGSNGGGQEKQGSPKRASLSLDLKKGRTNCQGA